MFKLVILSTLYVNKVVIFHDVKVTKETLTSVKLNYKGRINRFFKNVDSDR